MRLRPVREQDLPQISRWLETGWQEGNFAGNAPEPEAAGNLALQAQYGDDLYLVIADAQGEFLGLTGLKNLTATEGEFFIGLLPEFRRQGLGREAAAKVAEIAFHGLKLERIYMFTNQENAATRSFNLAMGFRPWQGPFSQYEGKRVSWFHLTKAAYEEK